MFARAVSLHQWRVGSIDVNTLDLRFAGEYLDVLS